VYGKVSDEPMKTRKPHQRKGILVSSAIIYPSDLGDDEWELLAPLMPPAKPGGRPRSVDIRRILGGIFYLLRSGCAWRMLPREYGPWSTVSDYYYRWRNDGTWERIHTALREQVRTQAGRQPTPSACILDSQSVKTTEQGGPHGYDGGKKVNGRKRHLLVDTLGLVLKIVVHAANMGDREGARLVLAEQGVRYPRLSHVWTDQGYTGPLLTWIKDHLGWSVEVVERSPRRGWLAVPGQGLQWVTLPKSFEPLPRRWVVERTFAWIGRDLRMSKDYERQPTSSETFVYLAMIRLMLARLAKNQKAQGKSWAIPKAA
jgi:putative transposase